MSFGSTPLRSPDQAPRRRRIGVVVLAAFICAGSIALAAPSPGAAATGVKVAVVVGPAGSQTAGNKVWANAAASEVLRHTTNVVKVYSPNATWQKVKAALTGASVVVYVGRGSGFPSVSSSVLRPTTHDGLGLNPVAGSNNSSTRYYGESYVRSVALAPRAVVLLVHSDYASGNSPAGYSQPSLSVARRRVDDYGAGFLAAGASAVIAEYASAPTYYVRAIFTQNESLAAMWRNAPTYHGHMTSFASHRTTGATGRTDPIRTGYGYTRSIVGRLSTSTSAVRQEPATCGSSLQAKVDGAPSGAILDLTGCTYAAGATIAKPLTIIGARVFVPVDQRGFIVMASDVTLDRLLITGPQASTYRWNEVGVLGVHSISNLVVRNSTIRSFGNAGIWVGPSTNSTITGNRVEDTVYAGIMMTSATGGLVDGNTVRRVGVKGAAAHQNNAYGIAVTNEGGAVSADVSVNGNTVETVPTWQALSTHAGVRVSFTNNTVGGSPRSMVITTDGLGRQPTDITVTGNRFLSPAPATTNLVTVTTYDAVRVTVTGNSSTGWGSADFFTDYQGKSVGLVVSGNTITP